ncbi:MAG: FKBP-type peptidyl-prolyl cis-trans isomerase [Acidobacteriota bacterium]|nr:FKBP-type peptidyl-prolyl cis-trans isomerase [Acidobacteriota bacterium]
MKRMALTALAALVLIGVAPVAAQEINLENDDHKALYALGLLLSDRLKELKLSPEELDVVEVGIEDGVFNREPKIVLGDHQATIDAFFKERYDAMVARQKAAGVGFVADAAKRPGAVQTESGMVFIGFEEGTGESPDATDTVKLHYHGTLMDGKVFDSSVARGEPASFQLDKVIPCFREGLQKMKVGGKATLYCPPDLAYGERGAPPTIPPAATLVFEVELLEIEATSN